VNLSIHTAPDVRPLPWQPQEQSAKVALWRLGLEQAIAAIEEYRGDVRDLLV
jgi:hypothetical protein